MSALRLKGSRRLESSFAGLGDARHHDLYRGPALDPAHPTILADLLARCTQMPVAMLLDDTLLAPDHVYILPADRVLADIDGGRVKLGGVLPAPPQWPSPTPSRWPGISPPLTARPVAECRRRSQLAGSGRSTSPASMPVLLVGIADTQHGLDGVALRM